MIPAWRLIAVGRFQDSTEAVINLGIEVVPRPAQPKQDHQQSNKIDIKFKDREQ